MAEELVGFESDARLDRYDALTDVVGRISEVCGEDSVMSEERYKGIDASGTELTVSCSGKMFKVLVLYYCKAVVASVEEVNNAR